MKKLLFPILILLYIVPFAFGQKAPALPPKAKLGLVLSGGGAKGLAHIGILKVLEEEGIYPDYITGTSMGSIIGGLYALGYSAEDISELNRKANWDKLLSDNIPMHKIVMEEKYEYNRYLLKLPIKNYKISLPSGLLEGQQLQSFFSSLTWRAAGTKDFDEFPYPFHCMSVDIVSGQSVELKDGELGTAMRASMAIPSVFAPVRKDTMLLVDGGVIRNFPVEEARQMGADITIGAYVGFEEKITADDLYSLSDILTRTTVFYGIFDSQQQIDNTDLLITPNMEGLSAGDFSKGHLIEQRGYEAADSLRQQIRALKKNYTFRSKPPKSLKEPLGVYISDVETENIHYVDNDFVIGKGGIYPGMWVSKQDLSEAVDNIFGTRYFDKITYRLEKLDKESYKLVYNAKESTRALLKVALHYDNARGAGAIINATFRNYLIPSSRAVFTACLSESPGLRLHLNNYIGKRQRLMDYYYINWRRTKIPVILDDINYGNSQHAQIQAGVAGKYSYTNNQQIGLGTYYKMSKIMPGDALQSLILEADFDEYGYGSFGLEAFYHLNTLDHEYFPTQGSKIDLTYNRIFDPQLKGSLDKEVVVEDRAFTENLKPFSIYYFNVEHYKSIGSMFTINGGLTLGFSSNDAIFVERFALGGITHDNRINFQPFAGMDYAQTIVPNFMRLQLGVDIPIISKVYFSAKANAGLLPETPSDMLEQIGSFGIRNYTKGFNAGIRINSVLGPIEFITGASDLSSGWKWLLNIGYTF